MDGRSKIVLGEEDFGELDVAGVPVPASGSAGIPSQGAGRPPALPLPAVTRGVPHRIDSGDTRRSTTPLSAGSWLTSPAKAPLVAAAIGVVLAWVVTEALGLAELVTHSKTGSDAISALWTGVVGVMYGGTILAFDSAVAGAWDVAVKRFIRAAPPMFAATFVGGWIGNAVYLKIVQHVFEEVLSGASVSKNNAELYLARGLGWALFGIGIGATVGILTRSRKRALNGALGGALGGAAGGLVFEFLTINLGVGASSSRLLGLVGIGALIALATRVIETARREAWLQVVAGGMVGKEFILYHPVTRLGTSPDCEIFLLKDPTIEKFHAQIEDNGAQRLLTATSTAAVFVNQTPVSSHVLRHGDQVQVGNTVVGYSERSLGPAVIA